MRAYQLVNEKSVMGKGRSLRQQMKGKTVVKQGWLTRLLSMLGL